MSYKSYQRCIFWEKLRLGYLAINILTYNLKKKIKKGLPIAQIKL